LLYGTLSKKKNLRTINLKTGTLHIEDNLELNSLVSFGSRINKKRGFFFISKVTGKHLPVRPKKIKETHKKMADLIPQSDKLTLFIGFAEAAVSLGQGVFEEYNSSNSFYLQTTRYKTSHDILLSFQEEHSHAPSHILYKPLDKELQSKIKNVRRIILIEDEITTGNTANNFIKELQKSFENVDDFSLYSILDWSTQKYNNFKTYSLYKGQYRFKENNHIVNNTIKSISNEDKNLDDIIPYNFSRYGIGKLDQNIGDYVSIEKFKNKKVLVLGTSEFTYLPYLLALHLENNNIDTYYQSTTRSPINIDGEIISKLDFFDNYTENIDNFLYNVIDKEYDDIIICYETTSNASNYDLKQQLENKFRVIEIFFKDTNV